jgi:hypothetical protein
MNSNLPCHFPFSISTISIDKKLFLNQALNKRIGGNLFIQTLLISLKEAKEPINLLESFNKKKQLFKL